MIVLKLMTVENLLFKNKSLIKQFPEFSSYYQQWLLAQRVPFLRDMGKKAILNLLNNLNENHLDIISQHYEDNVKLEKFNHNIIVNFKSTIDNLEDELNSRQEVGNPLIYRENDQVYISFWR